MGEVVKASRAWNKEEYAAYCRKRDPLYEKMPDEMVVWVNENYCNVSIDMSATDCINGYGVRNEWRIAISVPYKECVYPTCGYHSVLNPDGFNAGCRANGGRHRYRRGWMKVFEWCSNNIEKETLDEAFSAFLEGLEGE